MFPPPFISVIVPVHNAARTLPACLLALLAQDYPSDRYEIIAVDNNSTDATPALLASTPGLVRLSQTARQSSYASRNLALAHARGHLVAFTDADCLPAPSWLSALAAAFAHPSVLAAGGPLLPAPSASLVAAFLAHASPLHHYQTASPFLPPLLTANAAYRRAVLSELAGFDPRLYTGADVDLAWRLQLRYGPCLHYTPAALVYHQHRAALPALFRQYRRYGYGEICLDALYRACPAYPRTLPYQLRRLARQSLALLTYLLSFAKRLLQYPFHPDPAHLLYPAFYFVAESANIAGKLQALWHTRLLHRRPPARPDPGG